MTESGTKTAHTREGLAAPPVDLPYRLPWRSVGLRPGAHRGKLEGSGGYFHDFAPLLARPDPRRIDLRVSARDPFEGLYVRRFEQKSAVSVYALLDVSASMGFQGNADKMQLAVSIIAALASAARRTGDAFGLIGANEAIEPSLNIPASRSSAREAEMLEGLSTFVPRGRSVDGLLAAASFLAGRRKLVVLISDFHMPMARAEAIFAALSEHDIVPIILTDTLEVDRLPRWGILSLADLELGRRRLVVMRPSTRDVWQKKSEGRRAELFALAGRYGREPFEVRDRVDWDGLGAYLISGGP
jgi:uncharacterized protein (DUF58 family)